MLISGMRRVADVIIFMHIRKAEWHSVTRPDLNNLILFISLALRIFYLHRQCIFQSLLGNVPHQNSTVCLIYSLEPEVIL